MQAISTVETVLSLATAFKDTVQTFKNANSSLSKLPATYSRANQLLIDIAKLLEAEEISYTKLLSHNLNGSQNLNASLDDLKQALFEIKEQCETLMSEIDTRDTGRFRIAVDALWKKKKLEDKILALEKNTKQALRLFHSQSKIRSEVIVRKLWKEAQETARKQPYLIDHRLLPFQADPTPRNWIPGAIPVHDLAQAYLRRELGSLEKSLQSLLHTWFKNPPVLVNFTPIRTSWYLQVAPEPIPFVHNKTIELTFQARDVVQSPSTLRIDVVDFKIGHLAAYLRYLQMGRETVSLYKLRVELWTKMVEVYPDNIAASENLVSALTNLAIDLDNAGEKGESQKISDRVIITIQSMQRPSTGYSVADMQSLVARNLGVQSGHESGTNTALHKAEIAVQQMEIILGVQNALTKLVGADKCDKEAAFTMVVANMTAGSASHDHLFTYASMLFQLAQVQLSNKLHFDASANAKQALAIIRSILKIYPLYPRSSRILQTHSHLLFFLSSCNSNITNLNTAAENADYTQERAVILQKLSQKDPQRHLVVLMDALWVKRQNQLSAGKVKDARETYEQILGLRSLAVDSYSNFKVPSETEGDYYTKLAECHYTWRNPSDAKDAAQNAVSQYAALEILTPGQSSVKHFRALTLVAKYAALLKQYDASIAAGFDALHLLDKFSFAGSINELANTHMELLDRTMEMLALTPDSRALDWARDIHARIERLFRSLARRPPLQIALAPHRYALILKRHGLVDEAEQHLTDAVTGWADRYGPLDAEPGRLMLRISYLHCLVELPALLRATGAPRTALLYSQQAMDIAEGHARAGLRQLQAVVYASLGATHLYLLCDAGRYPEARELSAHIVAHARAREATANDGSVALLQALNGRAYAQLYALDPRGAVATAREAEALSRASLRTGNGAASTPNRLAMLYVSLLNIADGLGDAGDIDEALVYLAQAKEILIEQERASGDEVGTGVHSHHVVATKQARLLFAKGEHVEALEIIGGVVKEDRARATVKKSVVPALVNALHFAGIAYCTLGRHADGILAASEVVDIKRGIDSASELRSLIEVEEKLMTSRGMWQSVQNAKDALICHHQDATPTQLAEHSLSVEHTPSLPSS